MQNRTAIENLMVLGVLGIVVINLFAYFFQLHYHELPCPLCLMQRFGTMLAAFGLVLNLRFGIKSSHYALSLLAIIFTGVVASRQIALHVVPGTGAYGSPFLGLHFYTWVFMIAVAWTLYLAFLMLYSKQFVLYGEPTTQFRPLVGIAIYSLWIIILMNVVTTFLECAWGGCPSDPVNYLLLQSA